MANHGKTQVASNATSANRPAGLPLMRMQWRHLLFVHWPCHLRSLRPLVPSQLEIEQFGGSAWVGLIPFTMRDVLPAIIPALPGVSDIPAISAFHECNVRTYVTYHGQPGVWFFSLDAASRAAVWGARRFFHLPYYFARIGMERRSNDVHYMVERRDLPAASMRCAWAAGDPMPPSSPGELAYFLTERYMLYSVDLTGQLFRCRIRHDRWRLRQAQLIQLHDSLVRAAGINIDQTQPPVLYHADEMTVRAWPLEWA
jgi:uncharacterized protein YqjF (DUF2071 family)